MGWQVLTVRLTCRLFEQSANRLPESPDGVILRRWCRGGLGRARVVAKCAATSFTGKGGDPGERVCGLAPDGMTSREHVLNCSAWRIPDCSTASRPTSPARGPWVRPWMKRFFAVASRTPEPLRDTRLAA